MPIRTFPIAAALLLALAGCVPGVAEYTKTESPAQLQVYGSSTEIPLAFYRGSARLLPGQAAWLEGLVRSGSLRPADRVTIAASGRTYLADARIAAVSSELLRYGIVVEPRVLAGLAPNRAVLIVGHYAVGLPACPDWSKSASTTDFTNEPSSNFGCATRTNLGLMVANPADLASGEPLARADGQPAVAAVERYLNDKVTPLTNINVGPIGGGTAAAPPGAGVGVGP